jgi:hypothetical protein
MAALGSFVDVDWPRVVTENVGESTTSSAIMAVARSITSMIHPPRWKHNLQHRELVRSFRFRQFHFLVFTWRDISNVSPFFSMMMWCPESHARARWVWIFRPKKLKNMPLVIWMTFEKFFYDRCIVARFGRVWWYATVLLQHHTGNNIYIYIYDALAITAATIFIWKRIQRFGTCCRDGHCRLRCSLQDVMMPMRNPPTIIRTSHAVVAPWVPLRPLPCALRLHSRLVEDNPFRRFISSTILQKNQGRCWERLTWWTRTLKVPFK